MGGVEQSRAKQNDVKRKASLPKSKSDSGIVSLGTSEQEKSPLQSGSTSEPFALIRGMPKHKDRPKEIKRAGHEHGSRTRKIAKVAIEKKKRLLYSA
jgi:hypothetical protein